MGSVATIDPQLSGEVDIAWLDGTSKSNQLPGRGVVGHIRGKGQLSLVVRRQETAHPGIHKAHPASDFHTGMSGDAGQSARHIGHPIPAGTSQIAGTAGHTIGALCFACLLLVGIVYLHLYDIRLARLIEGGDIETRAQHVTADILLRGGRTGYLFAIEPEVGIAIGIVETEPHMLVCLQRLGQTELSAIPEGTAVLTLIHLIDVAAIFGTSLTTSLDIGCEHGTRHDGRHCIVHTPLRTHCPLGKRLAGVQRVAVHLCLSVQGSHQQQEK